MIFKRKRAIDRPEFFNLQKISPKDSIREKNLELNTIGNIYFDNSYTDGSYLNHESSNMDHYGSNLSFCDDHTTNTYQTSCSQIDLNSDFKYQSVASNPQVLQSPNSFGTHITLCKESLKSIKFIGQVDNKYILGISGSNIICFDQHAIDERIILESFPPYVPAGNFKSDEFVFKSMTKHVDINLKLAKNEFFALEIVYSEIINHWGFKVSFDKDNCKLIQVPVILGEALTDQDFLEFLREIMNHPSENLSLLIPPAVKRIYNSKACRSAVKFGDTLSREDCENLLAQLPHLKFPFQCAHGRVSTVPLFIL
jgi:DNA mismatch repair protein MLH3